MTQEHPMMKCGHAANATSSDGKPVCVICIGITPGADEIAETPPLQGRFAICLYNPEKSKVPSSPDLAFFNYRPDFEFDTYYCGCYGWD